MQPRRTLARPRREIYQHDRRTHPEFRKMRRYPPSTNGRTNSVWTDGCRSVARLALLSVARGSLEAASEARLCVHDSGFLRQENFRRRTAGTAHPHAYRKNGADRPDRARYVEAAGGGDPRASACASRPDGQHRSGSIRRKRWLWNAGSVRSIPMRCCTSAIPASTASTWPFRSCSCATASRTQSPASLPCLLWPASVIPEVGNRGHVTLGYGREKNADAEAEHVVVNPALEGMVGIHEARRWQEAAHELLTRATFSASRT